jgi:phosphohistidine phosphatase SixA
MHAMSGFAKIVLIVALVSAANAAAADEVARAWDALRADGHVALIRHASAPGAAGDPAGFKLDDCKTQRQLSEQGRAEARALGEKFRAQKVKVGKIISSQWCRCRETAELMDIGPVEDAATFNNAFVLHPKRDELTAGAREVIAAWRGPGTLVVATHGQNILALLGFRPSEGEIVVVAPDAGSTKKMRLIGRIQPGA